MKIKSRLKKLFANYLHDRGYHIERMVDYGDFDFDVFEFLIRSMRPEDPGFFFVQVGAHDGASGDPIHQYVQRYAWRGLLLEPQPSVFKKLTENYESQSQLHLVNAAIGSSDGVMPLYTVPSSTYLASFDRKTLERRLKDPSEIVELSVDVRTFETLAAEYSIEKVDLLQIDTEGFDFEVIRLALSASAFPRPSVIRYEHLHLSSKDRQGCIELLGKHDYQMFRDQRDTVAVSKSLSEGMEGT